MASSAPDAAVSGAMNGMEQARLELLREAAVLETEALCQERARRNMTLEQESFWMGPRAERVANLRQRAASLRAAAVAAAALR